MADVELFPYTLPALSGGEYQLDVWHAMSGQSPGDADLATPAASSTKLVINGPTRSLEPGSILAGFPAPGESAATPDRLPYLVFQQETLPWLYRPVGQEPADPAHQPSWLALVVLKESELSNGSSPSGGWISRFYPERPLGEVFRTNAQQVAESNAVAGTIGVSTDLCDQLEMPHLPLWTMVPTVPECGLIAHVRRIQSDEIQGDDDGYVSILLGTRQLEASTAYHLFLISLQDRDVLRLQQLTGSTNRSARFVVLHHYPFKTGAAVADFRQRIQAVDLQSWGKGAKGKPVAATGASIRVQRQGRQGAIAPCLYHGPLVDRIPDNQVTHTPKTRLSDVPVPSITVAGGTLPDISYQAAFELGRMLALSERAWLSALLDYRRSWQHKRAWQVMAQSRMGMQASSAASVQQKKSTVPAPDGLLKKLAPVSGLETVLASPIDALVTPARVTPATVSDRSGLRHLVGRVDVPGLDPGTVAKEKYGVTSQPNAMTVSSLESSALSALVGATTRNAEATQALKVESTAISAVTASSVKKSTTSGASTAGSSAPLFDGSLMLKGSALTKSASGSSWTPPEPPETLVNWLYELCLLRRVPFTYLVPHADLLPPESLRLFYLDSEWITHLVDGALGAAVSGSLDAEVSAHLASRVLSDVEVRLKRDAVKLKPGDMALYEPLIVTGVLLRSELVKSCPSLLVRAFEGTSQSRILRRDSLGGDCLLVLFYGTLERLELHEPTEGLRYGTSLKPNSRAELAWQDPAGKAADRVVNFAQWDGGIRTLDLGRNTPGSLFKTLPVAGQPVNAHHVAWALQRDPFIYQLDRTVSVAPPPKGGETATASNTATVTKDTTLSGKGDVKTTSTATTKTQK